MNTLKTLIGLSGAVLFGTQALAQSVPPGERYCLGPLYASTGVYASGQASDNRGRATTAHFTVKRSLSYSGSFDDSYAQDASAFNFAVNYQTRPDLVPGWFKTCGRNQGATTININLGLGTY